MGHYSKAYAAEIEGLHTQLEQARAQLADKTEAYILLNEKLVDAENSIHELDMLRQERDNISQELATVQGELQDNKLQYTNSIHEMETAHREASDELREEIHRLREELAAANARLEVYQAIPKPTPTPEA
jgi:uncharacterized coiled-coil DUF342 family protein